MREQVPHGMARSERILAEKLDLLYRNTSAIFTNFVIASVVTFLIWDVYPHAVLIGWLAAVLTVCAGRVLLQYRFLHQPPANRCTSCAARRFALGAFASGLLWGAICLGLPVWGDHFDFIVMAVVCAGMTAGAVTTISTYYPAYLGYIIGFAVPLTLVTASHPDGDIAGTGAMMFVYFAVISVVARHTNRFINSTVELRVDNQLLQSSLKQTQGERDAARTEKWSTLSQLSHELRTPLNAILGFSEAMCGEIFGSLGNRRYKDYAGHVLSSGQQLLSLADELLLLSQGESGALKLKEADVDVLALVRSLVDQKQGAANRAGLTLDVAIDCGLPQLHADKLKLRQMLLNLLDNAIKFTPPGGRVSMTAVLRDGAIVLTVGDTGIGMSADDIPRALQPFGRLATSLTNNTDGAGLPIDAY